jgi:hypothetical protein
MKGECSCLSNCNEVNYIVEDLDTREWFLGSNLQWGLKEYPKMRLRRDIIFGFTDLLGTLESCCLDLFIVKCSVHRRHGWVVLGVQRAQLHRNPLLFHSSALLVRHKIWQRDKSEIVGGPRLVLLKKQTVGRSCV